MTVALGPPAAGRDAPPPGTLEAPARALRGLLEAVLTVVFPSRCVACGNSLAEPGQGPLCTPCWERVPVHRGPVCRCGLPLGSPAGGLCGRCRRGLNPFAAGASLGRYEGALRVAVHELKYRGRRRLARRLATALLAEPAVRSLLTAEAVLVPVPLHRRRQWQRGFNQSALLARALGKATGLPVRRALRRRRDTPPQTGLSASKRRINLQGAFVLRRASRLRGRVVVLVDDVLTTGATSLACARALGHGRPAELRLLTVARA